MHFFGYGRIRVREALNQTWRKGKKGKMILVHEERIQVPDPEPTQGQRITSLELKMKALEDDIVGHTL